MSTFNALGRTALALRTASPLRSACTLAWRFLRNFGRPFSRSVQVGSSSAMILREVDRFMITVDYSSPLSELLNSANLDWVAPDVYDGIHLPTKATRQMVRVILFEAIGRVSSELVCQSLANRCLQPVGLRHLLTIASQCPERLANRTLVELGNKWHGLQHVLIVAGLERTVAGRMLTVDCFNRQWTGEYLFAATSRP